MSGSLGHYLVVVTPSPAQGAALRQLGILRTDDIPLIAAHWLTKYDSPALRRMAGLNGSEGWLIDQIWPEVLDDLGTRKADDEHVWDLAVSFLVAAMRAGDRSVTEVMDQVIHAYIQNDYPRYPPEAGHLYGLDDELHGEWDRTASEVLADAEKTLIEWAARLSIKP